MLAMSPLPEPIPTRRHRPTPTSTSISTIGSLSKPRIRILLAPYMSPYVVPMKKVETWELLLNLLSNLFGPSILTSVLKITDTQGDVIHRHVWEDLLEPGMTIVVDTGSYNYRPGEENGPKDERVKEKEKPIQAALPFGQPPGTPVISSRSSPKPSQSRDKVKVSTAKAKQLEGKLPDEIIEQWAKDLPKCPVGEEKRITTVSMFIQQGLNGSKVTLGQVNLDGDVEKMGILQNKRPEVQSDRTVVREKAPVQLSRKKSTVARVADCLHGIKSRYGSSISKESNQVQNSGTHMINEIDTAPRKEKQPKATPSTGILAPTSAHITTSSGAISNQPQKPARRTPSLKAFFRYFDEGKPAGAPRRAKSTPVGSAAAKKGKEVQNRPNEVIPRPTTAPPTTMRSSGVRQRANAADNSGYMSDGPPVSGALRRKAAMNQLNVPATSKSPKPATPKPAILDKPLPKLPYKFSSFPVPTPPRSPIIQTVVNPPQPQPQTQPTAQTAPTPPPPTHKIIPWDELNRRLAKETQTSIGAQLRKSSISAGISHRRAQSADSGYTLSGSEPLSFGVSRRTTAEVKNAEVAINGFGMKSKLVSVGKIGPQAPESSTSASERAIAMGRNVRRVASDDTIRSGTGSWRLADRRRAELKRPQLVAGRGLGLGIDISEALPEIEPLEVQGGRTIAIGVIPED